MTECRLSDLEAFKSRHGIPLMETPYLRAVVSENIQIVTYFIQNKIVTSEEIEKIYTDENYILEFEDIAQQTLSCSREEFDKLYEELTRQNDIFCAWLIYYNQFLGLQTQLNLVPIPEETQKYLDFRYGQAG